MPKFSNNDYAKTDNAWATAITQHSLLNLQTNPFPNKPVSFKNVVGKGNIAHNEQFFLFQLRFLPNRRTF